MTIQSYSSDGTNSIRTGESCWALPRISIVAIYNPLTSLGGF